MTMRRGFELSEFRPPTVAVDDHRDVVREALGVERTSQTILVETVEQASPQWSLAVFHTPTLVHRGVQLARNRHA